jgi:ketosteroid isomerase-like protein
MATPRNPPIFTTPADAALAFYQAFEAGDVDTMMATWAEDEEIVCVHPGGARLTGYAAVRAGWEQLFASGTRLVFRLEQVVLIETVGLAVQSAVEHVTMNNNGEEHGSALCTNVLLRTPLGWRMVMHHASPASPSSDNEPTGSLH